MSVPVRCKVNSVRQIHPSKPSQHAVPTIRGKPRGYPYSSHNEYQAGCYPGLNSWWNLQRIVHYFQDALLGNGTDSFGFVPLLTA